MESAPWRTILRYMVTRYGAHVSRCVLLFMVSASPSLAYGSHVSIGRLVQVSSSYATRSHGENMIAANPADPKDLIACSALVGDASLYQSPIPQNLVVYTSHDGGLHWKPTLTIVRSQYDNDPACTFGLDGTAYFAFFGGGLYFVGSSQTLREFVYRSDDGGDRWHLASTLPNHQGPDRPFVTVDTLSNAYRGNAYLYGVVNHDHNGMYVFRSSDRFATLKRSSIDTSGSQYVLFNSDGIVMPDGTYGVLYGLLQRETDANIEQIHLQSPNASVMFAASRDGGATFGTPVLVSDWYMRFGAMLMGVPALAIDTSRSVFRGRIYAAWIDVRTGRGQIRFARSSDGGKTWSPSYGISDNWARDASGDAPDAFMPELAVNRDGVVAATWYDRRDHPDNLGYDVRFSVSTDGGETFSPSVLLARGGGSVVQTRSTTLSGFTNFGSTPQVRAAGRLHANFGWDWYDNGGDTAGLAATSDGVFHPLWISRSSGLRQLFTSRVTVNAVARANGGNGLEWLLDLSRQVDVRYAPPEIDNASHVITIGAVIYNRSHSPLPSNFKVRLVGLDFMQGPIVVRNADNGMRSTGAVWNFRTASGKPLAPGEMTAPRELKFYVTDWPIPRGPFSQPHTGLLALDMKVLGR